MAGHSSHDKNQQQTPRPEWLHKHVHEPNPDPPSSEPAFTLSVNDESDRTVTVDDLARLPQNDVRDCYIVSTGHGISGPFAFGGVKLVDFVTAYLPAGVAWRTADVLSADDFGNRVLAEELAVEGGARQILLATHVDGDLMTRAQGLVRLIVPSETDDALRQVKWIKRIEIR